jgi:two-component system, LytTR family, response regulator
MPRALIIDDEPPARATLRQLLAAHPQIAIVGEAGLLAEARARLAHPDYELVFLDVQLRGGTGFDLVPSVREGAKIIFVTGYDRHAVRAFDVNALDYLVKPLQPERLAEALQRLPDAPASSERPTAAVLAPTDTAYVKTGPGFTRFVPVASIVTITSAENYSEIHLAGGECILTRQTLSRWEEMLPPSHFMRVQRQTIVNVERVEAVAHQDRDLTLLQLAGRRDFLRARRADWPALRARLAVLRPGNLPPE